MKYRLMRCKGWLIVSVAVSAGLAAALVVTLRQADQAPPPPAPFVETDTAQYKTNVVVRRQNFTWQEIESEDYAAYIENLRNIGCPERTIRDIIVADVNQLFLHRRLAEVPPMDHEWWRSSPDPELVEAAVEQLRQIERERRELLATLLGPDWETAGHPLPPEIRTGIHLSGPLLGDIAPENKERIYDLAARAQQRTQELLDSHHQLGSEPDPRELAAIRQETREELERLMTPDQLEEFLLRYSHTAFEIRDQLAGMEFTPDQFRALFRARDPYDHQANIYYEGDNSTLRKLRENLEQQREAAIRQALGPEFYTAYKLNQDPMFQHAQATAREFGAPAEMVLPIYEINQASEAERNRIRNDASLSSEERIDALAAAHAEQQKSLERLLGPGLFENHLDQEEARP